MYTSKNQKTLKFKIQTAHTISCLKHKIVTYFESTNSFFASIYRCILVNQKSTATRVGITKIMRKPIRWSVRIKLQKWQ